MEKKYNGLVGRQLYPLINGSVRELNDSCTVYAKVIFFFLKQSIYNSLTSGLNTELSLVALLAGHSKPASIWVLNPLSSLAVEQPLVDWLQLVNGQPVGCSASFIQPEVPRCHSLPIRTPRAQNEVS